MNAVMKPTQKRIARLAKVSQSAVSMILSGREGVTFPDETRNRVWRVAEELGYFRKRARTGTIGFLPTTGYASKNASLSKFYGRFLDGILDRATELGVHVLLEPRTDTKDVPRFVREGKVDGLIVQQRYPKRYVERLRESVPVVFLNLFAHGQKVTSILPDNASGVRAAVDHLRAMGHTRVGFFGVDPLSGREHVDERACAFRDCVREYGLAGDASLVCMPKERRRDHSDQMPLTVGAVEHFMKLEGRPTAIVSYADGVLLPFIAEARERGWRCPRDFSAVGFDNLDAGEHSQPPLTSVDQPMEEMGAAAVDELLQTIRDPGHSVRHLRYECRINVRSSVKRVAKRS
jgi:DNA-binding LacI/PurR family transcriptional regulator